MNRYIIGIIFICIGIICVPLSLESVKIEQDLEPSDYHFTPQPFYTITKIKHLWLFSLGIILIVLGLSFIMVEYKTD